MSNLGYEVYVKWKGRWSLVARCLSESDARLIADDRASLKDQPAKVTKGEKLIYQLG